MPEFDLGQHIVSRVLADRDAKAKAFIDFGWDYGWVHEPGNIYREAVFPAPHDRAWRFILDHLEEHHVIPGLEIFLKEFPSYELAAEPATPSELIEYGAERIRGAAASVALDDLRSFAVDKDYDGFASRCLEAAVFMQNQGRDKNEVQFWDGGNQDVEELINRKVKPGIRTGIKAIDVQENFIGFQPGNLITYLGRAKSGKTSLALLSALEAATRQYKRVMVVTVEISAQDVNDRLDAFSARVSLTNLMHGKMNDAEKDKVRAAYAEKQKYETSVYIIEPASRYTVTNLRADVDKYLPDYVIIDGFYFLTDEISGKPGASWEGHDNLARELKRMSMQTGIVTLVTHQVREKQLAGKKGTGIDDGAMMGGTGLIMASDLVFGLDVGEDHVHMITCARSRSMYFESVKGKWDWNTCTFDSRLAGEYDDAPEA